MRLTLPRPLNEHRSWPRPLCAKAIASALDEMGTGWILSRPKYWLAPKPTPTSDLVAGGLMPGELKP
jgi:hypothetical protein